jgi:hypothetical protein
MLSFDFHQGKLRRSISSKCINSTVSKVFASLQSREETSGLIDERKAESNKRINATGDNAVEKELVNH